MDFRDDLVNERNLEEIAMAREIMAEQQAICDPEMILELTSALREPW